MPIGSVNNTPDYGAITRDDAGKMRIGSKINGIDINKDIIEAQVEAEKIKGQFFQDKIDLSDKKLVAFSDLTKLIKTFNETSSALTNFVTSDPTITTPNLFGLRTASVSTSDGSNSHNILSDVQVDDGTDLRNFSLTVKQVASTDVKTGTTNFAGAAMALNLTGTLAINGQSVSVSNNMTLNDIVGSINSLTPATNVKAEVLNLGVNGPFRLVIRHTQPATPINFAGTTESFLETNFGINAPQTSAESKLGNIAFANRTNNLNLNGNIVINGTSISVANLSLNGIRDAINGQSGTTNVAADVVQSGANYYLRLYSTQASTAIDFTGTTEALLENNFGINIPKTATDSKLGTVLINDRTTQMNIAGTVSINGFSTNILATDALNDIKTKINSLTNQTNVAADIIGNGTNGKLRIYATTTGQPINFTGSSANFLETNFGISSNTTSASNIDENSVYYPLHTVMNYGNIPNVRRATDTITDLVDGVTLYLAGASPSTTLNVSIDYNRGNIFQGIKKFVDSYNELIDFVNSKTAVKISDNKTQLSEDSILFGDDVVTRIKQNIRTILGSAVTGLPGTNPLNALAQLGIVFEKATGGAFSSKLNMDGKINISGTNYSVLDMVNKRITDVMNVFGNSSTSSNPTFNVQYIPAQLETAYDSANSALGLAGQTITVSYAKDAGGTPSATFTINGVVYSTVVQDGQITGASGILAGLTVDFTSYASLANGHSATSNIVINQGLADKVGNETFRNIDTTPDNSDPQNATQKGYIPKKILSLTRDKTQQQEKIDKINVGADKLRDSLIKQYEPVYLAHAQAEEIDMMLTEIIAAAMGGH